MESAVRTERRWGLRKAVQVDVLIDNQPACLLHGRIGNISIGGLFVRTSPHALDRNARVELVLLLQENGGTKVYRMPAIVVRHTAEGAGLIFDRYNIDAFRTLVFLLRDSRAFGTRRGKGSASKKQSVPSQPTSTDRHRPDAGSAGTTRGADGAAAVVGSIYNQSPRNGESTN